MFDPYKSWLGIPGDQRPVTYYLLLGVTPREVDARAIQKAAARRLDGLTPHDSGPQADLCGRLRKEIEKARAILLDPARTRNTTRCYRKSSPRLRRRLRTTLWKTSKWMMATRKRTGGRRRRRAKTRRAVRKKKKVGESRTWLWVTLAGAAILLIVGGGVAAFLMSGSRSQFLRHNLVGSRSRRARWLLPPKKPKGPSRPPRPQNPRARRLIRRSPRHPEACPGTSASAACRSAGAASAAGH